MEMVWFFLAVVVSLLAVGCAVSTAVEVATGKIIRFWRPLVFHLTASLLALWLWGLLLGRW